MTMYEITLGNWGSSCRLLMESASELFGLFYIMWSCCFCFAVTRVTTAVFIAETNLVVAADDQITLVKASRTRDTLIKRFKTVFDELDISGDGFVCLKEFRKMIRDDRMKLWLSALELDVVDADLVFGLIDDGQGL